MIRRMGQARSADRPFFSVLTLIDIRDTIQMLVKLGKEIFIEGIDNESSAKCFENLRLNNELVCRYIQGYYYSSPIPKDEFLTFLEHRNSRTAD